MQAVAPRYQRAKIVARDGDLGQFYHREFWARYGPPQFLVDGKCSGFAHESHIRPVRRCSKHDRVMFPVEAVELLDDFLYDEPRPLNLEDWRTAETINAPLYCTHRGCSAWAMVGRLRCRRHVKTERSCDGESATESDGAGNR